MIQLIQPKTEIVGDVGKCLSMQEDVWGSPHEYAYATKAWLATQFKHSSRDMPNVAVLVWFTYYANIGGLYQNWGHVVSWVPGRGFLSSPYLKDNTQVWLSTLENVERTYKCTFVGYSEDISGLRVAKEEEEGVTIQDAIALLDSFFWRFCGRKVKQSELDEYVPAFTGGNPNDFFAKACKFDEVIATIGAEVPDSKYAPYTGAPLFTKED